MLQYRYNKYSQNGEDGIIDTIFKRLHIQHGRFIEFGAWDGKHLSNCYKLVEEGWSGIFIESDPNRFTDLVRNFSSYDTITCIQTLVGYSRQDSLDTIIHQSNQKNNEFDFISIDVDGLDYFIFDAIHTYLPKVICIEVSSGHSPTFPSILPESIAKNNVGQSIEVISRKGAEKGYFPLCYTGNLFLIKNEYKHLFEDCIKDPTGIYFDFLEHIVGPNKELMEYLYNLYCNPFTKNQQINVFGYIFPENSFMASFLQTKLQLPSP